ncbi:hypothetical protein OQA88_12913 [Cercophora sp. LCS_1]
MPPKITILGSLNIDLTARVPHHPLPGETLTASSFTVSPGGKGANQAVACAKLSRSSGVDTNPTALISMVGAVGADSYGELLRSNLQKHGVDVSGVEVKGDQKTGIAMIIVDEPTGENRIVLSAEANHSFGVEQVGALMAAVGRVELLVLQLEIPVGVVVGVIQEARREGVEVLFNPAPAVVMPKEVYEGLGHLVVNETEAALLGGVGVDVLDTEAGCEGVARGFVERGVKNVVITLGGRGVYYMGGGKKGLVAAEKAKVVDTTAAGDTFVGMYALGVVGGGFDIEETVKRANKAAAKTVQRKGAQDSIPWRDEL